jgi:hypothetical protein
VASVLARRWCRVSGDPPCGVCETSCGVRKLGPRNAGRLSSTTEAPWFYQSYVAFQRVLQLVLLLFRSTEFKELEIVVLQHQLTVSAPAGWKTDISVS